jgi:S-formylglutathione hydrolase FrmB
LLIVLTAFLALTTTAQPEPGPKRASRVVDARIDSKLMGRSMPYRMMLPDDYERSTTRYSVIYLLHGFGGDYKNWFDKTGLAQYSAGKPFILITPEGENGWYTDVPSKPNTNYESYIVKELIPEIDSKYRTLNDRTHRMIAGLSMGGYGALKIAIRNPSMFSLAGSFSGALRAAADKDPIDLPPGAVTKSIAATFAEAEVRKNNDIFAMVASVSPEQVKAMPMIYLACGTEDFTFGNNDAFRALLLQKKIPHDYRERPGTHAWAFWDSQVAEFLTVAERSIAQK